MKRTLLIVLLGLGTIAGFAGGCASMHHHSHHRHHRHARFENRVAEVCAAAAHRVYDQRAAANPTPVPPTTVMVPWTQPVLAVPATPPVAAPPAAPTPP